MGGAGRQQCFIFCSILLLSSINQIVCQLDADCVSDELHYLPRLPDFFDYVPIRRHAAELTTEIDAAIDALLNKFSEMESTCLCNATKVNRAIMDNARLCPRTSSSIAFDTQHCVRETPTRDRSLKSWTSSSEFTSVDSRSHVNGRQGNGKPRDEYIHGESIANGGGNHDNRPPGIIDGVWLKNTTSITPMTSRQSTSNINLHILIGIVVISAVLIIVLFGSMVWWMRKRESFTNTSFSGDCKRWFSWCKWSKKNLALRNAPVTGPFNNPVFCVGHDGDRDEREDERNVLSSSFESSAKRDSGYVGLTTPKESTILSIPSHHESPHFSGSRAGINGVPVLDLQMSPYRCYRPLRCDPADVSRDADDMSFNDSDSVDTESVVVTPSSQCSFITFNLDTSRDQILKPPLQTSV